MRRAACRIVEKLRLHGHEAFFAGGWVRDFLLHRKPKDVDIATSALPDEVLRLFPKSRALGAQFGVIQVLAYGHAYEVATFRHDHAYLDGRHPSTVTFSGPEEDASRRDFTANGLFYDPIADRVIDFVHGKHDIQNRLIRTIGAPLERFSEDKLRMLRAIRFSCNLNFKIVPETWEAIQYLAQDILQVSWERIRDELTKILTGPSPGTGLDLLNKSGLLQHILPEVASMRGIHESSESEAGIFHRTRNAIAFLHKPSMVLAMGTLLCHTGTSSKEPAVTIGKKDAVAAMGGEISEQICRRLRMSNEEIVQIVDLVSSHKDFAEPDTMSKSARIRLLRKPGIDDHLELLRAHLLSCGKGLALHADWLQMLEEYRRAPATTPLAGGDDLIDLGYAPGPLFKEILQTLEDLQYEGVLKSREDALSHIRANYPLINKSKA